MCPLLDALMQDINAQMVLQNYHEDKENRSKRTQSADSQNTGRRSKGARDMSRSKALPKNLK